MTTMGKPPLTPWLEVVEESGTGNIELYYSLLLLVPYTVLTKWISRQTNMERLFLWMEHGPV